MNRHARLMNEDEKSNAYECTTRRTLCGTSLDPTMTDDSNYYEALQTEIDELIDDIAGDDEPIVEAELHRNDAYPLMTACSIFAVTEGGGIETPEEHETRINVVSHLTAILDSQIMLSAMALADLPADKHDAGAEDVHIRLPEGLATTAYISALQCYMTTPQDSPMERIFGSLLASLTEEWPDISDTLESHVTENLDFESEDDAPGFTDIDISGPEEDDDNE